MTRKRKRYWQGDKSLDDNTGWIYHGEPEPQWAGRIRRGRKSTFWEVMRDLRPDATLVEPEGWEGQRTRQAYSLSNELNPRYVRAFRLYWMTGSYREVGRRMGIDHGTARSYATRALPEGWETPDEFINAVCECVARILNQKRQEAATGRFLEAVFGNPRNRRSKGVGAPL